VSSRVVLNDLNDFISPTLECIKPIKNDRNASKESKGNHAELMDVNYGNSLAGHGQEKEVKIEKDERNEIVEINLSDCLACSGCITSAESVLISMQSNKAFYRILNHKNVLYNHQSLNDTTVYDTVATNGMNMDRENDMDMDTDTTEVPKNQEKITSSENPFKIIVVSISSQSRASLANKFGFSSMQEIWMVLSNLFTSLGVDYVFDIDFARDISLLASGCEFMARFQASQDIPILASSCPGWVCYAEKYVGDKCDFYLLTIFIEPIQSFYLF
jgi:iron only hydrogenase large subunit-like protein